MTRLLAIDWLPGSACRWAALPLAVERGELPAAEAALVADTAERRRSHFIAGRSCARAALAALGLPDAVIGRSPEGAPCWPSAHVGSIAHCGAAAVAIAAPEREWIALGIDIEIDRPLADDAASYVLGDDERRRCAALPGGLARWALPAFSAKECVHKCLQPLLGLHLGFDEVAITFEADDRFLVEPRSLRAEAAFAGHRWRGELRRHDGLLFSLLGGRPA